MQLRKATQLEGTMKIADRLADEEYQRALRFVSNNLDERLTDEVFRRDWDAGSSLAMDPVKHPEMRVLFTHELIGTYVKEGLIEGSTI